MRKLIKRLNYFRVERFNNRGWDCFGEVLFGPEANRAFYVKRANWIYNLVYNSVMFKGVRL